MDNVVYLCPRRIAEASAQIYAKRAGFNESAADEIFREMCGVSVWTKGATEEEAQNILNSAVKVKEELNLGASNVIGLLTDKSLRQDLEIMFMDFLERVLDRVSHE